MEPALKPAALQTRTKKIGILATENTFNGRLFKQTYEKHANGVEVFVQPGYGLVELVEQGEQNSEDARRLLEKYLVPMMEKGADTLVLGCTHYPFLKEMIESVTQNRVTIIDPSAAVAAQTGRILTEHDLASRNCRNPFLNFFTTGEKAVAEKFFFLAVDSPFDLKQVIV
jgi:glutamate racemase